MMDHIFKKHRDYQIQNLLMFKCIECELITSIFPDEEINKVFHWCNEYFDCYDRIMSNIINS